MSRGTTAGLIACLALAASARVAAQTPAATVDMPVLVSATVVRALAVSADGPASLAADLPAAPRAVASRSAGSALRVRVEGQGPWLLRLVWPDRVSLAAPTTVPPARRRSLAAARATADAARLTWLGATLGLAGTGPTALNLPAIFPAPSSPATIVVQVAAD